RVLGLALLVFLSGCATVTPPVIQRGTDPLAHADAAVAVPPAEAETSAEVPAVTAPQPQLSPGTGRLIDQEIAARPAPSLVGVGEATFNFEGQSLHAV